MTVLSFDTVWQLAKDRQRELQDVAERRRRIRPRPPIDRLPTDDPGGRAA
jgi:hypothetical protein